MAAELWEMMEEERKTPRGSEELKSCPQEEWHESWQGQTDSSEQQKMLQAGSSAQLKVKLKVSKLFSKQ